MDDVYHEAVLDAVEQIPPGTVSTYGDIAARVGAVLERGGPRQVGAVLALSGDAVAWWRVVTADGRVPRHAAVRARELLRAENVPLHPDGRRVRMDRARWDGRT